MAYVESKTGLLQTATNAAATITAALVTAGLIQDVADAATELDRFRAEMFDTLCEELAVAQASAPSAAPKASSNGTSNPGSVILNSGKYKGQSVEEVYQENPGYVIWLSTPANKNTFTRRISGEFVAAQ